MIETLPFSPLLRCAHCQAALSECPEFEFEDWIVRCLECGSKNVIDVVIVNQPVADIEVVGWRQ
jgi:DNA-directed RNA polymerase subunit RPC12/RpoP